MKSTIIAFALFAAALAAPTRRQTSNLQTFTGALGGIAATPVQSSDNPDRPFQVKDDTFVNIAAALARSCDQQFNACANAANGGDKTLSVAQCSVQQGQCDASNQGVAATAQGNAQAGGSGNANNSANASGGNSSANQTATSGGNNAGVGSVASCT